MRQMTDVDRQAAEAQQIPGVVAMAASGSKVIYRDHAQASDDPRRSYNIRNGAMGGPCQHLLLGRSRARRRRRDHDAAAAVHRPEGEEIYGAPERGVYASLDGTQKAA